VLALQEKYGVFKGIMYLLRYIKLQNYCYTLSSLAALIAIITVLIAWYKSAREALSIKQVVIHQTAEKFTYIIKIKNIKPYAVTIKDMNCYKQKSFMVEKENNQKPKYSYGYQLNDMAFQTREEFTIQAGGLTEISIPTSIKLNDIDQLIIDMGTSHGVQLIICKNIILAPMSATLVLGMEFNEHYSSKFEALCNYYKLKIKYVFGKVFKKS
jgi:hypothetical protein